MVKFYESQHSLDYPFPAVSLAYFLRYPNPYARHVLSTDVLDRWVDPHTQRLHTVSVHLKRSKIPSAFLKLLPKSLLGGGGSSSGGVRSGDAGGGDASPPPPALVSGGGSGQSYILETSVVDVRQGWMRTESRNLEWTGVLSVVETQVFSSSSSSSARVTPFRADVDADTGAGAGAGAGAAEYGHSGAVEVGEEAVAAPRRFALWPERTATATGAVAGAAADGLTDVRTTVKLHSRLGQQARALRLKPERAGATGDAGGSGTNDSSRSGSVFSRWAALRTASAADEVVEDGASPPYSSPPSSSSSSISTSSSSSSSSLHSPSSSSSPSPSPSLSEARIAAESEQQQHQPAAPWRATGFLTAWSAASVQRSIEAIGVRRTHDHVAKSTEGLKLVLERLRMGGLAAVLEGMRRDALLGPARPQSPADDFSSAGAAAGGVAGAAAVGAGAAGGNGGGGRGQRWWSSSSSWRRRSWGGEAAAGEDGGSIGVEADAGAGSRHWGSSSSSSPIARDEE